jgi:hypothetical protein
MSELENEMLIILRERAHPFDEIEQDKLAASFPGAEILPSTIGGGIYAAHFSLEGFKRALERMGYGDSSEQ